HHGDDRRRRALMVARNLSANDPVRRATARPDGVRVDPDRLRRRRNRMRGPGLRRASATPTGRRIAVNDARWPYTGRADGMRPFVAPLGLLLVVMCGGITATYITCPGCIDRTRVNSACEWSGDTRFEIDPRTPAHQRHLVSDAQLAEELAIRHADSEFNRLYGYEAHGGLIDGGRGRNECMARPVRRIETAHSVTAEQGQRDRG